MSLVGAATSKFFVATKVLLQQTLVCCNKTSFVVTKTCLSQRNLSQLKIIFVTTNICHDKSFVVPKYFLHDKRRAWFCCDKSHVLLRQKPCFVATKAMFCCDKSHVLLRQKPCFVATEMILWQLPPVMVGVQAKGRDII